MMMNRLYLFLLLISGSFLYADVDDKSIDEWFISSEAKW